MKNLVATVILFAAVLFVSFLSVRYLNKMCVDMYKQNNSIQQTLYKENWSEANKLSKEFSNRWHKYCSTASIFANHTLIDEVSIEEHKLEAYIEVNDRKEAIASAQAIGFLLERIQKLDIINFQNIF